MSDPIRFCRYRSLSGDSANWVREMILKSEHFFSSPLSFNDPFDCRPNFSLHGSKSDLLKYFDGLVARQMGGLGREARRAEARRQYGEYTTHTNAFAKMESFRRAYRERVTSNVGVLCLSEVHDDILMWAHYADSHRGVCLVFDASEPFFATAQPVHYRDLRPNVNPVVHSHDQMLDAAMFTKSSHWSYEREWRILQYKKGPGVYVVPVTALKQVILGAEIDPANAAKVRRWAMDAPTNVSVISAALSPTEFKVDVTGLWQVDT